MGYVADASLRSMGEYMTICPASTNWQLLLAPEPADQQAIGIV
jgi:hypothetical protein